jgi:hypothetical protein
MMGAAIILVGLLVGGGSFFVLQAFATDPATLQVQTNDHINNLDSAQIQVHIQHGASSSPYIVTIKVTAPTGAGGPFCDTVTITTDGGGNGHVTVSYPDTGVASPAFANFAAANCSPAGTGGPSTELAGTYTATVNTSPAITGGTLSTTFTVLAPQHTLSGTGTLTSSTTVTNAPIAAPGSTTASPLYLTCTGTSPTIPSPITSAPNVATRAGSVVVAGFISTNTPGQVEVVSVGNPCVTPTVSATHVVYTLNDVTINPSTGEPLTGGLVVTGSASATLVKTITGTTTVTTSTNWDQFTVAGTGHLGEISGVGTGIATVVTTITPTGSTSIASTVYWLQLTNVPGS